MSEIKSMAEQRLGYLLLRDGHSVPLRGISPEDIKAGAKHRVPNPDADPLRHHQCLRAIVDRLGFSGDFGTYVNKGWLEFEAFLQRHHCTHRVGVFPADHGGCIDLYFSDKVGPFPRQLADRIFEAPGPMPRRVFLGYGVNWEAWDCGNGSDVPARAITSIRHDVDTAPKRARELFARRHDLLGQWGFIDDKLVDVSAPAIVDKSYWLPGHDPSERKENLVKVTEAVHAFRAVFDYKYEGWVDVIPFNDRLVVLRADDGGWDLIWRCYRDQKPPEPILADDHELVADLPSRLKSEIENRRLVHLRQEAWAEMEEHEAEQAFYDRGGSQLERRSTSGTDVLLKWLREQGKLPIPEASPRSGPIPEGFHVVVINGRKLAVSNMVTVGSFRQMAVQSKYVERRRKSSEPLDRANLDGTDQDPVGASWRDAQAYCAWMERQLGAPVRLPTSKELRGLHPYHSSHYERLADRDFPWEEFPPRPLGGGRNEEAGRDVPSAIEWSEPRFLEPGADVPEYPADSGLITSTRKRWIEDFPPRAPWRHPLPVQEHSGLAFIDAWDAYEWCQEKGRVSGRFWEGVIGAQSWGAYKNMKVTFRLVLEVEQ